MSNKILKTIPLSFIATLLFFTTAFACGPAYPENYHLSEKQDLFHSNLCSPDPFGINSQTLYYRNGHEDDCRNYYEASATNDCGGVEDPSVLFFRIINIVLPIALIATILFFIIRHFKKHSKKQSSKQRQKKSK